MSFNPTQFIEQIIQPTLKALNLYSLAAEQLLAGTCAQESAFGTYLVQKGGPALGVYQCEPETHKDIYENYLKYNSALQQSMGIQSCAVASVFLTKQLLFNLSYASAICRIHYLRVKEALPPANDIPALAAYWKKYYNTPNGKGKESEFIANWIKYCADYYKDKT